MQVLEMLGLSTAKEDLIPPAAKKQPQTKKRKQPTVAPTRR
jgi:hypothetical protein